MLRSGVLLAAAAAANAVSSFCDGDANWKVVFNDDFDAPLNKTLWNAELGVNNSMGRTANVTWEDSYTEDGNLVLRSRKLADGTYTSGGLNSIIGWQYGRFCVRAILPGAGPGKSAGMWPAHWMMPLNYDLHKGYNELDILEMINGDGTAYGTYWYWGPNDPHGTKPVRAGTASVKVADYWTNYHEYAIEWTKERLAYVIDGKVYKEYTDPSMLPVNPHYWKLNTAVGGPWPGAPNADTVFPAYHKIDFVRVSQQQ